MFFAQIFCAQQKRPEQAARDVLLFPVQRIHAHTAIRTDVQHVARARAERRFYNATEQVQLIQRDKVLRCAAKAAAMHAPRTFAIQHQLRQRQRQRHALLVYVTGRVHVLQIFKRGMARSQDDLLEGFKVTRAQSRCQVFYPLVFLQEMHRTQHRTIAMRLTQSGNRECTVYCRNGESGRTCYGKYEL